MSKDCNKNCKRCTKHLYWDVENLYNIKDDFNSTPENVNKIMLLVGDMLSNYKQLTDSEFYQLIDYVSNVVDEHPEFTYILENLKN